MKKLEITLLMVDSIGVMSEIELLEQAIEQYGTITDFSVMQYDENKEIIPMLECTKCLEIVEAKIERSGPHKKASCSKCGKYIKFIKQ